MQELLALRRSAESYCQSAPHLLDFIEADVQPGMHNEEMLGGYAIYTLMTKVPGSTLSYDSFCKKSRFERDEIRRAFKDALMYVCSLRL